MVLRPVYLALFSLTLLSVIAGSGAMMALAGKGHDVFIFSAGLGVGMSLVSALSLELWNLSRDYLVRMQASVIGAIAAMHLGEINPRLLLSQYATATQTPPNAADFAVEIECRRLLDRVHQLLDKTEGDNGCCRYCECRGEHDEDCPVAAARRLYQQGKAKRLPWREYKKSLPQDVL